MSNIDTTYGLRRGDLPFDQAVALGSVPSWGHFRKFAMNPDVDAGTEQIWPPGTIQVLPTAAGTASVVSSLAADDAASTGAREIIVFGLDANYSLVQETVTMDGLTPVVTSQSFLRIYRAYTTAVGSGGVNAGNISISIGGNLQAYIEASEGQTHISQYTVPADKFLLLTDFYAQVGRTGANDLAVQFQVRTYNENSTDNYNSWLSVLDGYPYEGTLTVDGVFIVPSKADIRVLATAAGSNMNMAVEYHGYIVDTPP